VGKRMQKKEGRESMGWREGGKEGRMEGGKEEWMEKRESEEK